MAGRLNSNFRFGNLAEHLGILLLKGVAAVAEVSRPEDVGLDAIATLLRPEPDGNRYAEDNFVIQLKAESETLIEYHGPGLKWFLAQTLPMFIGRVSLKEASIALYPTLNVNLGRLGLGDPKDLKLRFGDSDLPPLSGGSRPQPYAGGRDGSMEVWLGEPLMRWNLHHLVDHSWSTSAYHILKRFLQFARREQDLLALKQCSQIVWSTNDCNSIRAQSGIMRTHPDDVPSVLERLVPITRSLMLHAASETDEANTELMAVLITLTATLRKFRADIDPDDVFAKMFIVFQRHASAESAENRLP